MFRHPGHTNARAEENTHPLHLVEKSIDMRLSFLAATFGIALLLGGCGPRAQDTPEWAAALSAKTQYEKVTRQRVVVKQYDSTFDAFDEAYWSTALLAARQLDAKQISKEKYNQINDEANAVRAMRQRGLAAMESAASSSRRSTYCSRSGSGFICY